mgnify:CR=1 FL=1
MKSTGIVRKIDELGRVVIPMELRRSLGLATEDSLEVFTDGDYIILRRYAPGCMCCHHVENLVRCGDRRICRPCLAKLLDKEP